MRRIALLLVLLMAGCGSNNASSRPVTVFAAASLTDAFKAMPGAGGQPTFNFAGSQALVTQIQQGAPADVFASADEKNMQKLVDAGLVDPPKVFARNSMGLVMAAG